MRMVSVLVAASLVLAIFSVGPAALIGGKVQLAVGSLAYGLAIPPAVITLWLALWMGKKYRFGLLYALLLGPVIRLPVVLGAAGAIYYVALHESKWVDYTEPLTFWIWVLVAYIATLAVETVLLTRLVVVALR